MEWKGFQTWRTAGLNSQRTWGDKDKPVEASCQAGTASASPGLASERLQPDHPACELGGSLAPNLVECALQARPQNLMGLEPHWGSDSNVPMSVSGGYLIVYDFESIAAFHGCRCFEPHPPIRRPSSHTAPGRPTRRAGYPCTAARQEGSIYHRKSRPGRKNPILCHQSWSV